jgi:hypothetical protein
MDCIDPEGPPVEYICSVSGCGNQPVFLAVMEEEETVTVLVCGRHFKEIKGSVITYTELPTWLTNGSAYLTSNGDVVYHFDLGPEGDRTG